MPAKLPSPYLDHLTEQALRAGAGAGLTWLFQEFVSSLTDISTVWRATIWAAGAVGWSIACSLVARKFGWPGTASFMRRLRYAPPGKVDRVEFQR